MSVYPKFLYHKEEGAKLITSVEEEQSLGSGWEDTPAAFEVQEKSEVAKSKSRSKSKEVAE